MVDNYHTWQQVEKALKKLNYTFVAERFGYRNYRGVDGYIVQIKKSERLPMQYVLEICENRLGIQYRAFVMLITEMD